MLTRITLEDAGPIPPLDIGRVPIFLRFVITGSDPATFDCLNETDDYPRKGETIIPARMDGGIGWVHYCRRGPGKKSGREQYATYRPIDCPLTQDQLADREQWAQWVDSQVKKETT